MRKSTASDIPDLFGLLSGQGAFGLLKPLLPLHIADLDEHEHFTTLAFGIAIDTQFPRQ